MRRLIGASIALVFATAATPALAGERYDRKLEQAAMRIVAERIGDIRGGFSYGQKPRLVEAQETAPSSIEPSQQPDSSPSIIMPPGQPRS